MRWIRLWPDYIINGTTFSELNAEERGVWFSLLAMAGYSPKPGTICIADGVPYTLEQLAAVLKLPIKMMMDSIESLIKHNKITVNKDGSYSVSNWAKYQTEYDRQKPYRRGLQGKVTGKGYAPKLRGDKEEEEEDKEEKNVGNKISETSLNLGQCLLQKIIQNSPDGRVAKSPNGHAERWAKDIDKMIRIDGRSKDEVFEMIEWCQADSFWASNILSGAKLREKFDQMKLQRKRKDPVEKKPKSQEEALWEK